MWAFSMGEVKVAAIGAGMWGRNIVRALKELEEEGVLKLVAVVDADESRAKSVANEFKAQMYLNRVDKLAELGIDAATVAVPIDRLVEVAEVLVDCGINVFVEKPVSMNPDEIRELMDKAVKAGVVAQPGFIVRYDPASKALREELRGRGTPRYMVFKRLSRRPEHRMRFPIVYDLMIHDIDLANFLVGGENFKVLSVLTSDIAEGVPQTITVHMTMGKTHIQLVSDGLLPVKVREAEV
ncbi:MAG: Gfo/Idh/MocA family oxidoreductase, partial [Desulfurococcales archaeon]|nr:Gfo/Idh/MocA family oxidoreductase [Desulfurococcales archaeon]